MNPIPLCIVGGTGVFGRIIVEELLNSPLPFRITVAARDEAKFQKIFSSDSNRIDFFPLDLRESGSVAALFRGKKIAILAAGPFQDLSPEIARHAAREGVHYLDLCDWPPYYFALRQWTQNFSDAGLACIPGLSTLPGISIPLFCTLREEIEELEEVAIGLFIGNKNAKGAAAMASALRTESASAFDYPYPPPLGTYPAFPLLTPDQKIIPELVPCPTIQVGMSFEWSWARGMYSALRRLSGKEKPGGLDSLLRKLAPLFNLMNFVGTERGCVSVQLRGKRQGENIVRSASLYAPTQSQRIAALPSVIAAEALARGECRVTGWALPQEWMEPKVFLRRLAERGLEYQK